MKELNSITDSVMRYAQETGVSPKIHLDDFIFQFLLNNPCFSSVDSAVRYYFHDGANSSSKLMDLIMEMGFDKNSFTLLEFASGYGCVTRHLVNVISSTRLVSCDIHKNAVDFIKNFFGNDVLLSVSNPSNFIENAKHDVVFALSFFSHMPITTWGLWLRALFQSVKPGGVLIFTTQGYLSRKHFGDPIIPDSGFWFKPDSEQKDIDVNEYGQTIVTRQFVSGCVNQMLNREIYIFREAFWWGHQDLYVIRK